MCTAANAVQSAWGTNPFGLPGQGAPVAGPAPMPGAPVVPGATPVPSAATDNSLINDATLGLVPEGAMPATVQELNGGGVNLDNAVGANGKVDPKAVYQYLRSKGVGHNHAMGMLANIQAESGYKADINEKAPLVKGSRGGYGLFQHTGPRRVALEKFAGKDVANWQKQIDYALTEPDTKRYLSKQFANPEAATRDFHVNWERPADRSSAAQQKRIRNLRLFPGFDKLSPAQQKEAINNLDTSWFDVLGAYRRDKDKA